MSENLAKLKETLQRSIALVKANGNAFTKINEERES